MRGNGNGGGGGGHWGTKVRLRGRRPCCIVRSTPIQTEEVIIHPQFYWTCSTPTASPTLPPWRPKPRPTGSRLGPAGNGTAPGATVPSQREMLRSVLHQCQHGAVLAGGPGDACIGLLLANGGRGNLPTDSPQHAFHNLITSGTYMAGV